MVLSSISKKGEIERAFPFISGFGVDDITILWTNCVLSDVGMFFEELMSFDDHSI